MPFHIRHGAPGSYKSACAVWIDVLTWLKQGREVHTNIRGIGDVADFELAFGITLPDTAKVVAYDLRTHADRMQFAAWFHWLPFGAAIVIDEGQMIYPDRRDFKATDLDLSDADNPIDPETGHHERPSDIFVAIDMHRHYNWDGSVTTPNIKKLPQWFRNSVETAYKHDNRSHIPFQKGKTRIITHSPDILSPSIQKGVPVETLKVPANVFKVYGSTTTGEITSNIARKNPLKTPAVYIPAAIAVFAVLWTVWGILGISSDPQATSDTPLPDVDSSPSRGQDRHAASSRSPVAYPVERDSVINAGAAAFEPLSAMIPGVNGVAVAGWYGRTSASPSYLYRVTTDERSVIVSADWLTDAGFTISTNSNCSHDLSHPSLSASLRVVCAPVRREPSEAERASGEQAAAPLDGLSSVSNMSPLGYKST